MGVSQIAGAIAEPSALKGIFGFEPVLIGPAGKEIIIDVLQSESISYTYNITRDPVECGSTITDHIEENPPIWTGECVFTDMMWSATNIVSGLINGNLSLHTWRDKQKALYDIKNAKSLVNVTTNTDHYVNFLIESIEAYTDTNSGDCFRCRITATAVNIVSDSYGILDPALLPAAFSSAANDANKKIAGIESTGNNAPANATSSQSSKASSVLGGM